MDEGGTKLIAAAGTPRGPEARDKEAAFYNPAMRPNRDLSLLLVDAFARQRGRPIDVADVLAGTGARSLRLARLDRDVTVHANDADPKAIAAIEQGRDANGLDAGRVRVSHDDAHRFLASRRFDVVDVDPFGSPAPFLDGAMRATRHQGLVCLTATDTAALCGTVPRVCRRRYGAEHRLHQAPWRAEVGLRILAGSAIRAAGRLDRAATPVLSVFGGHWMRVVLRVQDGRQASDRAQAMLSDAVMDPGGLGRFARPGEAGPLWTGPLHESAFMDSVERVTGIEDASWHLFETLRAEAEAPPFWAELGTLRRHLGTDAPKRAALQMRLDEAGFAATPTHMDPQGIRTDADLDAIRAVW